LHRAEPAHDRFPVSAGVPQRLAARDVAGQPTRGLPSVFDCSKSSGTSTMQSVSGLARFFPSRQTGRNAGVAAVSGRS
jgi:hypothetical protein